MRSVRPNFEMPTDTIADRLNVDHGVQLVANVNPNFPQVMRQHTLSVVEYITWILCTIFSSFQL